MREWLRHKIVLAAPTCTLWEHYWVADAYFFLPVALLPAWLRGWIIDYYDGFDGSGGNPFVIWREEYRYRRAMK